MRTVYGSFRNNVFCLCDIFRQTERMDPEARSYSYASYHVVLCLRGKSTAEIRKNLLRPAYTRTFHCHRDRILYAFRSMGWIRNERGNNADCTHTVCPDIRCVHLGILYNPRHFQETR